MTFVTALLGSLAMTSTAWAVGPFFENFDAETTCGTSCGDACVLGASGFVNSTTDNTPNRDWTVDADGTTSSATGPTGDHTTGAGNYLYLETSFTCDDETFEAHLESPQLDIGALTTPAVTFWYHMFGDDIGEVHVDVLDSVGTLIAADVVPAVVGDQGDQWIRSAIVDLTAYKAMTPVIVRIRGVHAGTGFEGDTAVDDFNFFDANDPDAGILSVDSPSSNCNLSNAETVTVTVENTGLQAFMNVPISYTVNAGTPVNETFPGPLMPGQTAQYTFTATVDLSAGGQYDIAASIAAANDFNPANDSLTRIVNNAIGTAYTTPFTEDFEGATATTGWFTGGTNNEWALAAPASTINAAASGTQAYVVNATTGYLNDQDSFVQTACPVDLSAMANPVVTLNYWRETEAFWDGARVEYSLDAATWIPIGTNLSSTPGVNWYNDGDVDAIGNLEDGWSGSNGGYENGVHSLDDIKSETAVFFRVRFASDGSFNDDGFAFDDFGIVEANTVLNSTVAVTQQPEPAPTVGGKHVSHAPYAALTLDFDASEAPVQIDSITVTNTGTIMDADILWHLFADDGDGVFDIALDTQLANMIAQAGGTATLTTGMFNTPPFASQRLFVVAELGANAMVGDTVIPAVAANGDIVFAGSPTATVTAPYDGDTFDTIDIITTIPFEDDFSVLNANLAVDTLEDHVIVEAGGVGPISGLNRSSNDSSVVLNNAQGSLAPVAGTNFAEANFTNSTATASMQYAFDLASYMVANEDHIWLGFRWADIGMDSDSAEHVFLSTTGGASWDGGSIFEFDFSNNADDTWVETFVDFYDTLNAGSLDYTDNMVVRMQVEDSISSEYFLLDWVKVGVAPETALERDMTVYLNGDSDMQGSIPALPQTLTYTVTNGGDFDLVIDPGGFAVVNDTGVSNVTLSQPANLTIAPGGMETLVVNYEPAVGAFSFDIEATANGPIAGGTTFSVTVDGTGETPANEILVERPAGTEIASGSTDSQGNVMVGMQQELTYTVTNTGNIDLNLSGVTLLNDTNVTASLSVAPMGVLAPQETTTFAVQFTPDAAGAFSFDISLANDDADESPYLITVDGTGEDMGGVGGGGPSTTTGAGGGATTGAGGSGGDEPPPEEDGGCSCSTPGNQSDDNPLALLAMAGLAFGVSRRRRRR